MPDTIIAAGQSPFRPYLCIFNVTVTGGTGSHTFTNIISGKCYTRQVNPPIAGASYTFYVQNVNGDIHDTHGETGFADANDISQWVQESAFYITSASADGTYVVKLWIGE